ncbi:MAG: glycosyltransferase family 2 protein [Burkholderiaceae bacterium]
MDLSILIVTYNSAGLIDSLLNQLQGELTPLKAEVVLVDNASRDGTAELVASQHPWVKLVASRENLGFAAGNNLAAQHASGHILLLLNPDAIPETGALARGLALMAQHPDAGLAGGELRSEDGSRQPSARMFPTLRDEWFIMSGLAARYPNSSLFSRLDRGGADPDKSAVVDWIPGAFVFIPASLWAQLGGLDERFFMYSEEVDFCRRLFKMGYRVYYWPELKAMHIGGASAKTVEQGRVSKSGTQLESWRMRSNLLYYRKHHGAWGTFCVFALEWAWHKLRLIKAQVTGRSEKAADFAVHCQQLSQAWRDTDGGRTSPARPW